MKIRWSGGRIDPYSLKLISRFASSQSIPVLEYMTRCTVNKINGVPDLPVGKPVGSENNRRSTIIRLIKQHCALESERAELYGQRYLLSKTLAEVVDPSDDMFTRTNQDLELDGMYRDLIEVSNRLLDPKLDNGIINSIVNNIDDSYTIKKDLIVDNTHFVLASPHGTVTLPFKVIDDDVWLGCLPKKSVIYFGDWKLAI